MIPATPAVEQEQLIHQVLSTCSTCHGSGHVTRLTNTMLGQMQTTSVCPSCGGEGKTITKKCTACYGEGIVQKEEIIKINIPAGVGKGMQMTVGGKGNAPRRGGVNGDLLVVIDEEEHPELIREGNDLIYNLFISIPMQYSEHMLKYQQLIIM